MTIENKQQRESAFGFGDGGTIAPDGVISGTDRQTLLGSYPFGEWGGGKGGFDVDVWIPHMAFPTIKSVDDGVNGQGTKGDGVFRFEVGSQMRDGSVLVHLSGVTFNVENKADRSYKDLIGENANPKAQVENEDDGIDVV